MYLRGVAAVLVVLASVGAPALAAPTPDPAPESRVPLDTGRAHVGSVAVEGTTYHVYRYDNALSYADGVEMYADGRVTDPARAEDAAAAMAWRAEARDLTDRDLSRMRDVRDRLGRVNRTLAPAARALDAVFAVRERLRGVQVRGVDAWTVASTASLALPPLMTALERLRAEIRAVRRLSAETATALDRSVAGIERLRAGESVDYDRLNRSTANATRGLSEVNRRASNLSARLDSAAGLADDAANQTRSVPRVGDRLAGTLTPVVDGLRTAAADVETFAARAERERDRLRAFRTDARSRERATVRSWRARNGATARVYGTGVALVGLLLGGAVAVRRRDRVVAAARRPVSEGGLPDFRGLLTAVLDPADPHADGPPYCPVCGTDLVDADRPAHCPSCGADLDDYRENRR